jgi:CubicO group peptidase (beta-lactamase class C family)
MKSLLLASCLAVASLLSAASPLPASRPRSEGIDPSRLEGVYDLVGGMVRDGRHAGASLLVVRHGRVVGFQAFGSRDLDSGAPMERNTICRIYSMSKVVTAVAVLQSFERNRFNLDSPVAEWLPELKAMRVLTGGTAENPVTVPADKPITVRMLLNHTAGFTYDFGDSVAERLYRAADLWNSTSLDDFIGKVGRLPLVAQPGTTFTYSISDDILGVLVQRVSGLSFEEYVRRNITAPLQMVDTGFDVPVEKRGRLARLHAVRDGRLCTTNVILGAWAEAGRGIPSGGGGMFSTLDDYARFAQCLLNGGVLDGKRILGRKTIELARMNSLPTGVHAFSPAEGWGLFSAVRMDPVKAGEPVSAGTFYWSGAATTHFFVDPKEEVVALVFCQHLPFDPNGLFTRFRTAVMQAVE